MNNNMDVLKSRETILTLKPGFYASFGGSVVEFLRKSRGCADTPISDMERNGIEFYFEKGLCILRLPGTSGVLVLTEELFSEISEKRNSLRDLKSPIQP